ncbi:glycosyltransferase family 4 protein [Chitinophaga agri]|uniref:Glycosyltransferase family 4 protein n=1 Tax=Chitinophaga agri TaxID=2703787 RepID=A0A6B9ZJM1_9BACT|nr:glycosyltransferase family 4 protein [Chitinophaga agri]QHS61999.1 glycosyltransferase family 4 protein [Chitinophaga agri]
MAKAVLYRFTCIFDFIRNYDVVHVNSAKFGIAAYIASFFGCRYIYTIHSAVTNEDKGGILNWVYYMLEVGLLKIVAGRAMEVTAVSAFASDEIYRRFKVRPTVIHNGYDEEKFNISRQVTTDIRASLGMNDNEIYISVGRMIAVKEPLDVIRFFSEIYKKNSAARLIFVGDGDLVEAVKQKISSLGLDDVVTLIGRVNFEDIPAYYRASDYFISACKIEAFGLVALEALACGAMPLVPWKGAFPEIFVDRIFSYDVDHPCVIPAREELLAHRSAILNRFRWEDKIELYHQLYQKAK